MESKCLNCKEHKKNLDPQVSSTSNGELLILSKCAICKSKKSAFPNKQQAKKLLSNLGINIPSNKVSILGEVLF